MTQELFFGSTNTGKITEVRSILGSVGVSILTPIDLGFSELQAPEESGDTFAENAQIKALYFAHRAEMTTLAEDSGLLVAALDGFPGVLSARWHSGSDADRNLALLKKMESFTDRSAQFQTAICVHNPKTQSSFFFYGILNGTLADSPKGTEGFGYDPIFIPTGYSRTLAELGTKQKNAISHRRSALNACVNTMQTNPEMFFA